MGVSKSESFTEVQNKTSILLKAFAHPARIAIIEYLMNTEGCICSDIVNELPLAQPTISQHLKELRNANIIQGTVEGSAICYCINQESVNFLVNYFSAINNHLTNKKCC